MSTVCGEDAQDDFAAVGEVLVGELLLVFGTVLQQSIPIARICIAKIAFAFCLKCDRKMKFRKLCDKLRKYLEDISKVSTQTAYVSISKPETQQMNLETRLNQVDCTIQMELLMTLPKKTQMPKTITLYYQKLAMVF